MKKELHVELALIEEILGTQPSDPNIHRDYVASKAPNAATIEEEVKAVGVEAVADKAMTIFPRENGKPFVYDYQIKGFFKDACSALNRVADTLSGELKAYKKIIDGTIFVAPRKIMFECSGPSGNCQRPLRAQTPQGERVALANSETLPEGTIIRFTVILLDGGYEKVVREWLNYGVLRGLGQWRNSGKGRFTYRILEDEAVTKKTKSAKV